MTWYNVKGAENDVVVSSRVRFARNIADYPFASKLDAASANEIIGKVKAALPETFAYTDFAKLTPAQAQSYVEKHYVSSEFVASALPHVLASDEKNDIHIMICEEDHLRMQCILPGLALGEAYEKLCGTDDIVCDKLNIAYDEQLGFLTHCPTNLGTGMRASAMLFLPALTMTKQLGAISPQLSKIGLTLRGMYGEGSEAQGCLYQISNQVTLGITEEDTIKKLSEIIRQITDSERRTRSSIKSDNPDALSDMCLRSYGAMRYAHMISSGEFMKLYSDVRLGIALGLIKDLSYEQLGDIMVNVLPATLSLSIGSNPNEGERDKARAAYIRKAIGA